MPVALNTAADATLAMGGVGRNSWRLAQGAGGWAP
jgi:hypothetical protein